MISRTRPGAALSAALLWLAVCAPPAAAQVTFLHTVRELAATASPDAASAGDLAQRRSRAFTGLKAALEEWDRGIQALESRVARELRDATGERAFQLRIELGLAYRQRGRMQDALRQFDAAAAAQPRASDVHLLRALTHETAGNTLEAGRAFRTAWMREAENPVKAYLALRRAGDLEPADRGRAQKALRDALPRILASDDRVNGAPFLVLDLVPDTLSRTPVVGDGEMAVVFARLAEGAFDEALAAVAGSGAIANAPDDSAVAHFVRGRADETEGRLADARRAYETALAGTLAGRYVLYVGIGRLAQVEGELEAATAAFDRAVRLNPNESTVRRELANTFAAAGRLDDAFAELVAGLLVNPRDADTLAAIGQLFVDTDRAADALPILRRAVELSPDRLETHYALAVALSRAGRGEDAARQYERFERLSRQALESRRREVTGLAAPAEAKR